MDQPEPTNLEIEILRVLWARPGATVRDVHDELTQSRDISFSAINTTLRRMLDKGLARCVDERRPQKFEATSSQEQMFGSMMANVRHRIFGGSLAKLIRHALGSARPTQAEVDEVKRLLDEHDRGKKR